MKDLHKNLLVMSYYNLNVSSDGDSLMEKQTIHNGADSIDVDLDNSKFIELDSF